MPYKVNSCQHSFVNYSYFSMKFCLYCTLYALCFNIVFNGFSHQIRVILICSAAVCSTLLLFKELQCIRNNAPHFYILHTDELKKAPCTTLYDSRNKCMTHINIVLYTYISMALSLTAIFPPQTQKSKVCNRMNQFTRIYNPVVV